MRLYCFTNYYLNSVAQGIQPLHVLGEMNESYPEYPGSSVAEVFHEWQSGHKTVICLNGGNLKGIKDIYLMLSEYAPKCDLPFAKFHEDEDSLGGIMTSCGVVLPASMFAAVDYKTACLHPDGPNMEETPENTNILYYFHGEGVVSAYKETSPEFQIIKAVKSCPLAK